MAGVSVTWLPTSQERSAEGFIEAEALQRELKRKADVNNQADLNSVWHRLISSPASLNRQAQRSSEASPSSSAWQTRPTQVPFAPKESDRQPRYVLRGMIFGSLALVSGIYFGRTYASLSNEEWVEGLDVLQDQATSPTYDRIAPTFDDDVESAEQWNGIQSLRKKITSKCSGDVLEVAVGTGRNAEYYLLQNCRTITMLDESGPMLDIAKGKWSQRTKKAAHSEWREWTPDSKSKVNFYLMSAADDIPLPPKRHNDQDDNDRGFTTILSTFSLCSMPHPAATLAHLCSLLAPAASDGSDAPRVLLLEHGQSYFNWINTYLLDKSAYGHAKRFGCWWNRDIGAIVKQAADEADMEIVEMKRKWLDAGTTWIIEMRPKQELWQKKRETCRAQQEKVVAESYSQGQSGKSWWKW